MKLIGSLLIIIVTTWIGFEYAKRLSDRPKQLRQLKVAVQSLEAEMMYGLTPLAEAADHIAKQLPKPIGTFFQRFSEKLLEQEYSAFEAWQASINEIWNTTALLDSEREVMLQFGATLGQHDLEQQQKQIHLTLAHLAREEQEAREKQHRYEKMVKSLGFLAGLLVVILLV